MAKEKKKNDKNSGISSADEIKNPVNGENAPAKNASQQNEDAPSGEDAGKAADERDKKIEELEQKLKEAGDSLLRTAAEYDNFRKRTVKEKDMIYSDSRVEIIGKLLPVIDNFERAASAQSELEDYKKGIEMTVKQLLDVFSALGAEAFGAVGEQFDPNIHNGVMHIDDETLGENVIADVFVKGYKLGDKVIRCAAVKVAN